MQRNKDLAKKILEDALDKDRVSASSLTDYHLCVFKLCYIVEYSMVVSKYFYYLAQLLP